MSGSTVIAGAEWLGRQELQQLLEALSAGGEEARIAGGAVRNALLAEPVSDIDIATTNQPAETARRAEAAGFKSVPTGAEHGTITVVAGGRPYEVTTLRADVETEHRTVEFHGRAGHGTAPVTRARCSRRPGSGRCRALRRGA